MDEIDATSAISTEPVAVDAPVPETTLSPEENARHEHAQRLIEWLNQDVDAPILPQSPLDDAVHAFFRDGLFDGMQLISTEDALLCWRLVEIIRRRRVFPPELKVGD